MKVMVNICMKCDKFKTRKAEFCSGAIPPPQSLKTKARGLYWSLLLQ